MANWRKLALLAAAVTALGGCRLDMHVQPRQNPLSRSDFFPDQRAARPLLAGTAARERGRVQYHAFCGPCQSRGREGNGYIPPRGFARKRPSFHIERLEKAG